MSDHPYLEVQKRELANAADRMAEHFDSVLVLCSSSRGQWFLAERGNDFASVDLARRYLSGMLNSPAGPAPTTEDGPDEGDSEPTY